MPIEQTPARRSFRHFFFRGLAILLPTVLTIWLLIATYSFVRDRIAEPINTGIREGVIRFTPYPTLEAGPVSAEDLSAEDRTAWELAGRSDDWLEFHAKRAKLNAQWKAHWVPMDLIGLLLAIALIYVVGRFVGSYVGSRLYRRGEDLIKRTPIIRQVYPSVKQVTDFLVGGEQETLRYKRVVAVEYPRKGLWSVGLATGDSLPGIQNGMASKLMTVFIPSSPTPFTGYVITVPEAEVIDLNLTIDQALKFTISGGVLTPTGDVSPLPDGAPASLQEKVTT